MLIRLLGPAFLAFALPVLAPAPAGAATLKADYLITLEGLSLGRASLDASVDDSRYELKIGGQATGMIGAISGGTRASAFARGVFSGNRPVSTGFSASSQSSTFGRTVQVGFAGGTANQVDIEPPFEPRPERVPVTEANKRGVIDPLGGTLDVADNRAKPVEAANCNRTVPVFDGSQRFNVVLSYSDTRFIRQGGYVGMALICAIRYVPIAGHRTDRESVKFMAENRDMSVWLAPIEGTRVLVPIRISLKTMIGTSVVEAQSWKVTP